MYRTCFALCLLGSVAQADITVTFAEGAPKDRFTISSTLPCATGPVDVVLDFANSAGGLIFDVTGQGAGVEVFQPFDLVQGAAQVASSPVISDGDSKVTLKLSDLSDSTPVAFTIDVDDTGGAREITVNGSEIEGATVSVIFAGQTATGLFDASAVATVAVAACTS